MNVKQNKKYKWKYILFGLSQYHVWVIVKQNRETNNNKLFNIVTHTSHFTTHIPQFF